MITDIIPITDAGTLGKFYFSVTLGSVDYQLAFHYNDRDAYWYFNVYDAARENLLRAGVRCVINTPLLRLLVDIRRPVGELVLLDTRTTLNSIAADPDLEDLGRSVQLAYCET